MVFDSNYELDRGSGHKMENISMNVRHAREIENNNHIMFTVSHTGICFVLQEENKQ